MHLFRSYRKHALKRAYGAGSPSVYPARAAGQPLGFHDGVKRPARSESERGHRRTEDRYNRHAHRDRKMRRGTVI